MTFEAFLRARVADYAEKRRDDIRRYADLLRAPEMAFTGSSRQEMQEEIRSALGRADRLEVLVQRLRHEIEKSPPAK